MMGLRVLATGRALPRQCVSNAALAPHVNSDDEWIYTRTGIRQRYFVGEDENSVTLAVGAAGQAIDRAGIDPQQIGAVLVATFTGEYLTPSAACLIQRELELSEDVLALDLNAACSGFVYGLRMAHALLQTMPNRAILLIGSETPSRLLDFSDRGSCILFGDGAGAVVLTVEEGRPFFFTAGARGDTASLSCRRGQLIRMAGNDVFRFAVRTLPESIERVLAQANRTLEQVDHVICHQANERIIRRAIHTLGGNPDRFYINIDRYGNTSAASIPIALDELAEQRRILPGQWVLCAGFGGGFTWGSALFQW